ncbi:MAG: DUF2142 domain-containing protein [Dongiaceae bacterium]
MPSSPVGRLLPWIFVLYAGIAVIFLACAIPPLQVPDEPNHFLRADEVSRGEPVGRHLGATSGGGTADPAILALAQLYAALPFHGETRTGPEQAAAAAALRWSAAPATLAFGNTVTYGPLLYLPAALAIRIGRARDQPDARTLILARLCNGMLGIAIGALALALCRRARALTFAGLLLPMTLGQLGSASQDALLIPISVLAVALASRRGPAPASLRDAGLFAACVVVAAMARLPMIGLAALAPLLAGRGAPAGRARLAFGLAAAALVLAWVAVANRSMPGYTQAAAVRQQLAFLLSQPLAGLAVARDTVLALDAGFWRSVVGLLGWVDTPMPRWYYTAAAIALAVALWAGSNPAPWLGPALLAALTIAVTALLIGGALYLTWTPVGAPTVLGLQGRYLLPLLPLAGWLAPPVAGWAQRPRARLRAALWLPVLLFPVATLATLPHAVIDRYYGSAGAMAACLRALLG